jgi:hypothetical protein
MQLHLTPHTPRGAMAWAAGLAGRAKSRGMLALAGLLLACALAMGGSAAPEVTSLEILRPLAAIATRSATGAPL